MNFGKSVKKLASEFNVVLSLHKSAGVPKTNYPKTLGELKCSNTFGIPTSSVICNPIKTSAFVPCLEKFNFITINNNPTGKKIEEPGKIVKIKIKLPVGNEKKSFDLPCSIEKEIQEPLTEIISKKAHADKKSIRQIKNMHIVNIRRRKMRVHKRKKYMKKHRIAIRKKRAERALKKEYNFHMQLKDVIKTYESFSPEEYLSNTLKTIHWKKPVTKVRGRLAPQWVIKEYLSKQEEKALLKQRLEECINFRK